MSVVRKLVAHYDHFQIDLQDWEIEDQGVTALWGASGAGKSSVLRLLLGLDRAKELVWEFRDSEQGLINIGELPVRDRRLGVVFQNYELFDHMTVGGNLDFAALASRQLHRRNKLDFDERALEENRKKAMTLLKIEHLVDRSVSILSGGERQRVAIVRALLGKPRMLFLDEPFSALDSENRKEARRLVKEVLAMSKIPALLVTHDMSDIAALDGKIYKIENGRLI